MRIKKVTETSQTSLKYTKQFKYMAGGTNVYDIIEFDSGTGKSVKIQHSCLRMIQKDQREISDILALDIIEIFCKVDLAFIIN